MPVSLEYRDHLHTIILTVTDPWTANDAKAHYPAITVLMNGKSHKVHALFDIRATRSIPHNLISTGHGSPFLVHPSRGLLLIVGGIPLFLALVNVMIQLFSVPNVHFFETIEPALEFIAQYIAMQ